MDTDNPPSPTPTLNALPLDACPGPDKLDGHPDDCPDGGLTAWLTALGAFLIQFGGFGLVNAFGVFQDYYSQHYLTNVSSSTISWIGSTNSFLVLSGGLFFGHLCDRGYFRWLVIGGCILETICLFMLSLTQKNQFYQIFLCHGLGFGLATSMSFVPSLAVLSHHFKKRRAIVMTMVASGSSLGAAAYTILLNSLFNGRLGFANGVRITAATNAVLLFIGCALVRTRPSHPKTQTRYSQLLRTSFTDYPYIFASFGFFFFGAGSFFPIFYIQLDSSVHGLGQVFSFYTIVMLNGGSCIGRLTAGFIAARCGIMNAMTAATLGTGIFTFAVIGLSTRAGAACIGIFFGYFAGLSIALVSPLVARLTEDLSVLGARLGIGYFMAGLGSLVGTPLAGQLLGLGYTWWRPAVFCGCLCIASTAMFATAGLIVHRRKHAVSVAP